MKKIMPAIIALGGAFAAIGGDVSFKEDTTVLPTYAPGGYDKTPLFYTGRVYQGAQGRVYPYPMQDVLHDEKIDETNFGGDRLRKSLIKSLFARYRRQRQGRRKPALDFLRS